MHTFAIDASEAVRAVKRSRQLQPVEDTPTLQPVVRPGLLRIEEAADWLGLSKRKMYELLTRGEIQSVYIGRSRRITFAALQRFVDGLSAQRD